MFELKKLSLLPVLATTCLNYVIAHENIQNVSIISADVTHSGEKFHISLCGKFDSELSSVRCEILVNNNFFYMYKTHFVNNLFDIDIPKGTENGMKKMILSLKKDISLKVLDENPEIVNLDLSVKKRCPSGDSKIYFNVTYTLSDGKQFSEKIEKAVSINPKEKIVSVGVNGSNLPVSNNGNYKAIVPENADEIELNLVKTDGTILKNEKITKKLNKTQDTKIKIADSEIIISKEKVQKPKKGKSKSKITKKAKNKKSTDVNKNKARIDFKESGNKITSEKLNDKLTSEENLIEKIDNIADVSKAEEINDRQSDIKKSYLIPSSCMLMLAATLFGVIIKKKSSRTNSKSDESNQEQLPIK